MTSGKANFSLINLSAYLIFIGIAAAGNQFLSDETMRYTVLGLLAAIAFIFALMGVPPQPKWKIYSYMVVQTVLIWIILWIARGEIYYAILFSVLSAQAFTMFNRPVSFIWLGIYTLITGAAFITFRGLTEGLSSLGLIVPAFLFFGFFALAWAEADSARRRSQELLIQLQEANQKLHEMAIRDALTGLYNRRYLIETLDREIARTRRENAPLCVVVIDIDHFKKVNDTYGHHVGDLVLEALGKMLLKTTREEDIACRFGGEEFVVAIPGMPLEIAQSRAETWRHEIEILKIECEGALVQVTISLGVAAFPEHATDGERLINRADQALYAAKQSGRNRVTICY